MQLRSSSARHLSWSRTLKTNLLANFAFWHSDIKLTYNLLNHFFVSLWNVNEMKLFGKLYMHCRKSTHRNQRAIPTKSLSLSSSLDIKSLSLSLSLSLKSLTTTLTIRDQHGRLQQCQISVTCICLSLAVCQFLWLFVIRIKLINRLTEPT